ncbi:MAG: hypothetical protein ACI4LA_06815 [Emergencia sp.]
MKYKIPAQMKMKLDDFLGFCRKQRRQTAVLLLLTLLLLALQICSVVSENSMLIKDQQGNLIAIEREPGGETVSVPLKVRAEKAGLLIEEEVTLTLKKESAGKEQAGADETDKTDEEQELLYQVKQIVSELAEEGGNLVSLPGETEDGAALSWASADSADFLGVLLIFPLGMLLLYRQNSEKTRTARKLQEDQIRRGLPAFHSQLLLLLESGLIFSDAFSKIAEGYAGRKEQDALQRIVIDTQHSADEAGCSLITVLGDKARELNIREFTRLSGILTDNQHKGVSLKEKLESESGLLWNQRKKLAEEKGRAAETQMAFPLAVLLLVLIIITAAPAILEM